MTPKPRLPAALILALLLAQAAACIAGIGPSLAGQIDLRAFYTAGTILRTGHAAQLYSYPFQQQLQNLIVSPRPAALPFLYPPFAAIPFVPLSFLPYRAAFFTVLLLNIALLIPAAKILRPTLPALRTSHPILLPALYACLFATSITLMQGQISIALLVLFILAHRLQPTRPFLAGALLALTLAKFQFALPILLLFLLWNQLRLVLGFLAGATTLLLASLALVGTQGLAAYTRATLHIAAQTAQNPAAAKLQYGMHPTEMPNLHGLTFALAQALHAPAGAPWPHALAVLLSLAILAFAARQGRRRPSLAIAIPAAMLVSYHMQPHDLTLLLLPLTLLFDHHLTHPTPQTRTFFLATLPVLTLPCAAILMALHLNFLVAAAVLATLAAAARYLPQQAHIRPLKTRHHLYPLSLPQTATAPE